MEEEVKEVEEQEEPVKKKVCNKKKKCDEKYEKLALENTSLNEKILRISADMQNMKRRYDLDIANMYKYDGADVIEKLLPVIDNFERALSIKQDGAEKFLEGFKMIYESLINILKEKGITEIYPINENFDPVCMNAISTGKNKDLENNIVLEVFQKGYMYNDKLLRPAMVQVNDLDSD